MDGVYPPRVRLTFITIGALGKVDLIEAILKRYDRRASTRLVRYDHKYELECMIEWPQGNKSYPFIDEIRREVQYVEITDSTPVPGP